MVLTADVESNHHALVTTWDRGDMAAVVVAFVGGFLPGFALPGAGGVETWADGERRRLRMIFARAAGAVVHGRLSVGHFHDAVGLGRRVRDLHPAQDTGWRLLRECLVMSWDVLHLVPQIADLERLLAEQELDAEPATRSLLAQARQPLGDDGAGPQRAGTPAPLVAELVGCDRECAAVIRAWETAVAVRVEYVHLVAPAGLGKTRLSRTSMPGCARRGRASPAWRPPTARDIACGFASDVAAALGAWRSARGVSRAAAGALVAVVPALSTQFDAAPDPATSEEALRRRAVAVRALLATLTKEQPLAVPLDDLHWVDTLSLRLLAAALGGLRNGQLLVVGAARLTPGELADFPADATMPLAPLSEAATASLLEILATLPPAAWAAELPAALAAHGREIAHLPRFGVARWSSRTGCCTPDLAPAGPLASRAVAPPPGPRPLAVNVGSVARRDRSAGPPAAVVRDPGRLDARPAAMSPGRAITMDTGGSSGTTRHPEETRRQSALVDPRSDRRRARRVVDLRGQRPR